MWNDIKIGFRSLVKARGFSVAAVTVMALCIGANTAIFSVVNSVLWKPLSFPQPARLVAIKEVLSHFNLDWGFSTPDYLFLKEQVRSFSSLGAYTGVNWEVSGIDRPARIDGDRVTPSLFQVLGVKPQIGRVFSDEEDQHFRRVAVISNRYWREITHSRKNVIGQTIYLDRQPYTIVGVMPRSFVFPLRKAGINGTPGDVFIPMSFTPFERTGFGYMFNKSVIGRLKPRVSLTTAAAEVKGILKRSEQQYPSDFRSDPAFGLSANLLPYRDSVTGSLQVGLLVLLSAIGVVLLIGCANVANLLLARSVDRRREFAVRCALGASRADVLRQVLTESVLLSLAAGLVGFALAVWLTPILIKMTPVEIPRLDEISIDLSALFFTFGICCLTPLIFGLAPAFEMSRLEIASTLREGGRTGTQSRRQRKWMSAAVIAEYGLTVVLLVGAGLLLHSFLRLRDVDPGFRTEHILSMAVNLPKTSYQTAPEIHSFYDRLLRGVQAIPGVEDVGAISDLPLKATDEWGLAIEGRPPNSGAAASVLLSWVSGDAMKALGMKLVAGRFISDRDTAQAPNVMVINEALARQGWPTQNALGKRFNPGGPPDSDAGWYTVVGVVRDVRQGLSNVHTKPEAFESLDQGNAWMMKKSAMFGIRGMRLVIKSAQEPMLISSVVQRIIAQQDPSLPVTEIQTLDQYISASIKPQRFDTYLVGLFGGLALLLAVIGIGGVLSYSVAQRTNELGVRMALGGNQGDILRLVMTDGLKLAAIGIAGGIAGAFAVSHFISSLLYQTSPQDAWTFVSIPLLLLLTTIAASLVPAWRATRIDPMAALRAE